MRFLGLFYHMQFSPFTRGMASHSTRPSQFTILYSYSFVDFSESRYKSYRRLHSHGCYLSRKKGCRSGIPDFVKGFLASTIAHVSGSIDFLFSRRSHSDDV